MLQLLHVSRGTYLDAMKWMGRPVGIYRVGTDLKCERWAVKGQGGTCLAVLKCIS